MCDEPLNLAAPGMNYYRRWIGDYLKKTRGLSITEHGAYALLLDTYYADESPLPAEFERLERICGATQDFEREAVRSVADKYFPVGPDGLRHNERADEELGKAKEAIEQMSDAGRQGAEKRWGKGQPKVNDGVGDGLPHRVNGEGYGEGHGVAIHPPTSNLQPPSPNHQPPSSNRQEKAVARARRTRPAENDPAEKARPTWKAYEAAYFGRYKVKPLRDRKNNALMLKFVDRVGVEEAPGIAAFYVAHSGQWYVRRAHSLDMLVNDADKLRTEWRAGRRITDSEARRLDRSAGIGSAFDKFVIPEEKH